MRARNSFCKSGAHRARVLSRLVAPSQASVWFAQRPMAGAHIPLQIESARPRGQRRESMIPAFAFQLRTERVHPEREWRLNGAGVFAEGVSGTQPQALLE